MSKIINFFKWIGKNPKKSIFFSGVGYYGFDYAREKYLIGQFMREICLEAKKYGDERAPVTSKMRKVLVVLNPVANKRNCEENYEKFCSPIFALGGIEVDVVKTQSELHAIRYLEEELEEYPDAIVIAGGDGTVSEAVTGLLRKAENDPKVPPLGVLPVGQNNNFSLMLLNPFEKTSSKLDNAKIMARAALAVVEGETQQKDVMKIQLIQNDDAEPRKPFYALSGFLWGPFNDILKKKDRYWLTGIFRTYTAFLFNGFGSNSVQWNCKANLIYTEPCSGCMNCYEKTESRMQKLHNTRWWSKFNTQEKAPEYSKVLNPNCQVTHEKEIDTDELVITTNTIEEISGETSKLNIKFNENVEKSSTEFISKSWSRVNAKKFFQPSTNQIIEARTVTIIPSETSEEGKEIYYSIDNEQYEVLPIKITVQPYRLRFFVQKSTSSVA